MEIKQIKETCLYVKDLDKSKYFYHNTLGFSIIAHIRDRHIFFRAGTSVLLCFIAEITKSEKILPPHFAYGHQHIAFEISAGAYKEWKEKITSLKIPIIYEHTWPRGLKSFYFKDPDGHVLEIVPEGLWDY